MDNFIESFDDYKKSKTVTLAEKEADDNTKIKDLMDEAKEAKSKATEAKNEYDNHVKAKAEEGIIEVALLKYKRYRAVAELKASEAKLLKKGILNEEL
jgi:hypothetical protein